jgi:hypothetical protein
MTGAGIPAKQRAKPSTREKAYNFYRSTGRFLLNIQGCYDVGFSCRLKDVAATRLLLKRWLNEEDQCHSQRSHATE